MSLCYLRSKKKHGIFIIRNIFLFWISRKDTFQVKIEEHYREETSFLDGSGRLMQYCRMPLGYKNAPSIFQRGMSFVLSGLVGDKCFVYIDDILIFVKTLEEHDSKSN